MIDDDTLMAVAALLFSLFVGFAIGMEFGAWTERPKRDGKGRFAKKA